MCRRGKLEEHVINADGVLDLCADTYDEFDSWNWYNEEMRCACLAPWPR
jgi:hypothetical protein